MNASRTAAFLLLWVTVSFSSFADAQDDEARAHFDAGLAAADAGDDVAAERAFRASLEIRWSVSVAYNLAQVLARHESVDEALSLLRRIQEDETTPAELRQLARSREAEMIDERSRIETERRRERARTAAERAREAEELGDLLGARTHFEEAWQLTANPEHLLALARLERRLGREDEARARYRAYLAASPDGAGRDEAETFLAEPEPAPEPVEAGGSNDAVIGVTASVGGLATITFGILSGVYWQLANDLYDELVGTCPAPCAESQVSRVQERLDLTTGFLIGAIGTGALTATLTILFAVLD